MQTFRAYARMPWLILSFLVFSGAAAAQQTSAPVARAAAITTGVRETKLPNGLRVLTKEVHNAPIVSFAVWYKVGSRNEHEGLTGSSHLLEHMLFKGTKKYGLGEISRLLFINGATFNASTYYDWTNYYETLASDRLELAMQIESDRMVNSRIDAADMKSEMSVVRSELEGHENDPGTFLSQAVSAAAFQAHPYRWPVIGWRSDVEYVSAEAVRRYYRSHYGPNNATIVIVGDFDTRSALEMVRRYFGPLKPIPTPPRVYTKEPPQRGERRVKVRRPGTLPMVQIAYHTPEGKSPDFYALDALAMVLSSGRSSRLYRSLIETQIASGADAVDSTLRDPSLFVLTATAAPGTEAGRLEEALLEEVERLKNEPVSAEELARAKNQIEASFVLQNDSVSAQANQLGYWTMVDDWRYLTTYLDRVKKLTPDDLQRVARKYFTEDNRTVGHFIPSEPGGPAGPPPAESSARVDKPRGKTRPLPLPRPSKAKPARRNVTRFRLPNGISVVVNENHTNPTFALQGSLPAGSVMDPRDRQGIAGLTAAMLTRGTEKHTAREFAALLEDVGASLGAGAETLSTSVGGLAQTKDFDRVMDLLAEMLRQPTFPERELERLKTQALAGLEQEKDDPSALAGRAFGLAVYPEGHPLRPVTREEAVRQLQAITREDLLDFYRQQYDPDRMILVVAGDVTAARVRQALESRLGDWPKNPSTRRLPGLDLALQAKGTRQVIHVADKSQAAILWGQAGLLKRSDPDFYAAQVLNMILGGGGALNSRLGNVIRDEQGLAYDVESFYDASLYPGPFQVSMGTNPANAEKAIRSLQAQVRLLLAKGVTQREVDEAVAYITGRFPQRLETNAGMAGMLWTMEFYNLGPDYIDRYAGYYRAVTVAQVNAAAKKHLNPDRATLIVAGTLAAG
jgi:zinc protease